jgi:hypothetical protein
LDQNQEVLLAEIREQARRAYELGIDYWKEYSSINDLQFWIIVLMVIVPLVILLFKIDTKNTLLLAFYGLNYHVWFAYTNSAGIKMGLWEYPFELLPILPSFALDASLVPVCYMLVYQWTLNHKKSFYFYSTLLSGILAFVFKPILVYFNFFRMFDGINYLHLFLFYIGFFLVSKGVTNIFLKIQKK